MTCKEKLKLEHPELISDDWTGGCYGCPGNNDFLYIPGATSNGPKCLGEANEEICRKCWGREVEVGGVEKSPYIDIHKIIDDAMKKKDRVVSIYISDHGTSINVTPLEEPAHWERIVLSDDSLFGRVRYRCSNCKIINNYAPHFCPACGEEMHGVKEVKE